MRPDVIDRMDNICYRSLYNWSIREWDVKVNDDGKASGAATLSLETPTTGSYYVSLGASSVNAETIVACGNLAPPTS